MFFGLELSKLMRVTKLHKHSAFQRLSPRLPTLCMVLSVRYVTLVH
jgi:hypothetical protein